MKKILISLLVVVSLAAGIYLYEDNQKIGKEIDSYKGVPVYYNGIIYIKSQGRNYSSDEEKYYYGQKWQCVEYIKRFYYEAKNHKMPDVMGHAKDYFDPAEDQGEMNKLRGLIQYKNGGDVKPAVDDLLVFNDTKYGHVAIITKVSENSIEVIQQNIWGKTRENYELTVKDRNYYIGTERKPAGWLRKE